MDVDGDASTCHFIFYGWYMKFCGTCHSPRDCIKFQSIHTETLCFLSDVTSSLAGLILKVFPKYTSTTPKLTRTHSPIFDETIRYSTLCLLSGTSETLVAFGPLNAKSSLDSMEMLNVRKCMLGFSIVKVRCRRP